MDIYEHKQNEYFSDRFRKYGFNHRSLSWESPFTQNARFVELLKVCTFFDISGGISVLDFGCGLGHLYKFIKDNGLLDSWRIAYTGTDINEDFINEARIQYPEADLKVKDDSIYGEKFDFAVCSGVFNLKFSEEFDIREYYGKELSKLYGTSGKGVAVNFQGKNALELIPERLRKIEKTRFYFHEPETVISDLKKITGNIRYSDGYLPGNYDFTVYLLK